MRSSGSAQAISALLGAVILLIFFCSNPAYAQLGVDVTPSVPGDFDPEADLRAPKPLRLYAADSLHAGLVYENLLFRVETDYDSTLREYVSTRTLFGEEYGFVKFYTAEEYREYRINHKRKQMIHEMFYKEFKNPSLADAGGGDGLEIQVPFKIKSKTFRRIFGGDRVGLNVSGQITIDGGLRREKSDQVQTTQTDQANYNFKIDQTQRFRITGKVGDKVRVEIDQDSERIFEFENAVKLEYTGEEDEIIQSIEAGNVSLSLPGTQLATVTANNEGLFGFKTVSQVGPLSITAIASLQKGEKNKKTFKGGSEATVHKISDTDYLKDQYFFLDEYYRSRWPRFSSNMVHLSPPVEIKRLEVYKSVDFVPGDNRGYFDGWALFTPPLIDDDSDQAAIEALNDQFNDDEELQSSKMAAKASWKILEEGIDYTYSKAGWLRLNTLAMKDEIVAVAYELTTPFGEGSPEPTRTKWGVVDPTGQQIILKLLKPQSPTPDDSTWNLSWQHVYSVGTSDLKVDDFVLKVARADAEARETTENGKTWLEIFGLDRRGEGSDNPDGLIDPAFVNYAYGEVIFPDLRPFDQDPANAYTIDNNPQIIEYPDSTLRNPNIYDILRENNQTANNFNLQAEYSNTSANISLGFNILEGSEEVFLNGAPLARDRDYIIDYLSGQITILNDAATAPGADLEINYESGEILQLDKKTMVGIRVEYSLWEDSFIGGTFLYFNEQPLDKRVKVGQEPTRNLIWDLNARLRFRPYFMTRMVDALPLIVTDEESEVTIEGEIAQVFPNPNSLNNESTGDPDGVAYIDDFEAAKRSTPLGVMRKSWFPASHPDRLPIGDLRQTPRDTMDYRAKMNWYNPYQQVKIKDIWPNREVNSKVAQNVHVLTIEYEPEYNNYRQVFSSQGNTDTWNGVMRWLSSGYNNQTNTKFIDIWMKWSAVGDDAAMYIDMGEISEDVIPNGEIDTEDLPVNGDIGNGVLDEGEDVGLDGRTGKDPNWDFDASGYDYDSRAYDWWDLDGNGLHDPGEPFSSDNWSYERGDYEFVNGTENSATDDGGRFPDTEDLDRNNNLNRANNFYRYRYRLSHNRPGMEDFDKYVIGGQDNPRGWRLIRIPIEEIYDEVGDPKLTQIKYLRLWFTGARSKSNFQIAQFELVGNDWLEQPIVDSATKDTVLYVSSSTINTHDNPEDYNPPPGVAGEIDPITDVRSKEQSLVMQVLDLPTGAEGQLTKILVGNQSHNYREYKYLKLYVNGGGRNTEALKGKDLVMFFRFGTGLSGANKAYYEYSQRLSPGWKGNEIIIDIDRLTRLKKLAEEEDAAYEVLSNGDVIKVIGQPSIGAIKVYALGVRNFGPPIQEEENIEIWVDEMRLSGVRKEPGMAMRSSVSAKFADFLDLRVDMNQEDAEFHRVDQRTGSPNSTINSSMNGTVKLGKFISPKVGFSIPVRGSAKYSMSIPKYTTSNGDIRTESIAGSEQLNIWDRFFEMIPTRDYMEDKYLLDELGEPILNEDVGTPYQDLTQWGIDTLFSTEKRYSWGISVSKNKASQNPFVKYSMDKLNTSYDHSQSFSSNLRNQYQKKFTNSAKVGYTFPFEQADLGIFKWAEPIPFVNKISDTKFNYWPTRIATSIEGTESSSSSKYRNAAEKSTYKMNLSRNVSTGYRPFNFINMDYSYAVRSQMVKEDSVQQDILYNDQPDSERARFFAPGTPAWTMIDTTVKRLRKLEETGFDPEAGPLADELEEMAASADSGYVDYQDVVDYMYQELEFRDIQDWELFKVPWNSIQPGDPGFNDKFWTAGGFHFVDTQKTQRISSNFNPSVVSWFTTDFNYSTSYTWNWQNFTYTSRGVNSTNSLGANFVLKLRSLMPSEKGGRGGGGRGKDRGRGGRDDIPGAEGFGRDDRDRGKDADKNKEDKDKDKENGKPKEEERPKDNVSTGPKFSIPNPMNGVWFLGRKIQDIRLDYTQNLTYTNPALEDGDASLEYQLGFSGDPGLKTVPGIIATATSSRSDDYRMRSGIDWSNRVTSSLEYGLRFTKSTGNQVTGSHTRSAFLTYGDDNVTPKLLDAPNWTLRWSGLEQLPVISKVTQSVTLEHSYNGSATEEWTEQPEVIGEGETQETRFVRQVSRRSFEKTFSPLAGLNITWKYGISTNIRYNYSVRLDEQPKNNSRPRDTNTGISVQANYTRKTGFRIPIPIWPFKNRRFSNETTFSLAYDSNSILKENQSNEGEFKVVTETKSWSFTPSLRYNFSRTVNGGIRYKYGVTEAATSTTQYQEFGINVNISIRG
ncbi:cell surface protein SprA [bacterium]|nr:cell surface protein SprA [bacterium]